MAFQVTASIRLRVEDIPKPRLHSDRKVASSIINALDNTHFCVQENHFIIICFLCIPFSRGREKFVCTAKRTDFESELPKLGDNNFLSMYVCT